LTRRRLGAQDTRGEQDLPSVRFEVRDRTRRIVCAVSDEALEAVSDLAAPSTDTMRRRSFDRFRTLIDAAAKLKLSALPDSFLGPVLLSSDDLRRVPAEQGVPLFGSSSWTMRRAS
jgi:hypothetical protein